VVCFKFLTSLVIVCCFVCGQAVAQEKHHWQIKVVPRAANQGPRPQATLADNLYGLSQVFVTTPAGFPLNTDGSELWPCFGDTSSANPDCPSIGNPSQVLPTGGVVLGGPQYVWSLAACDGTNNSGAPCGQTETFYEDDTNDTSPNDDLTYLIVATQVQGGKTVTLADSGTVDFGPNPFGGASPAADVIISGDQTFGSDGAPGKNNGNCEADFNYPSPVLPGVFVIQANKTCVDPIAGPVTLTATTEVATAVFTTKGSVTTVKYTKKFSVAQKWTINLQ